MPYTSDDDFKDRPTEAAAGAALAYRAQQPYYVDPDGQPLYVLDDQGRPSILDIEQYANQPSRARGTATVRDAASFVAFLNKHYLNGQSEVWADPSRSAVVGVINASGPSPFQVERVGDSSGHVELAVSPVEGAAVTGWGDHCVKLALATDPDWAAWVGLDKQWLEQEAFAEFVQQHGVNIRKPDGATMLEVAQSLQATKSAAFESSKRLSNGEVQLTYKEDLDAKAGRSGQLAIPEVLELVLRPYEGSPAVTLRARFRYRIDQQNLRLGIVLDRPQDAQRTAFDAIVDEISKGVPAPVFIGTAPSLR